MRLRPKVPPSGSTRAVTKSLDTCFARSSFLTRPTSFGGNHITRPEPPARSDVAGPRLFGRFEVVKDDNPMTTTFIVRLLLAAAVLSHGAVAHAGEAEFLESMDGNWSGEGTIKVRANSSPMTISCKFASDTTDTSLSLDGKCTGLMGLSRAIGATIRANGAAYRGSYRGAGTGVAGLNGKRSGT